MEERRRDSRLIVKDRVYGEVTIQDQAAIDLIQSAPLLRIQKVTQFGLPDRYYYLHGYSRFDHSLGVMHLLNLLGASREEQIAGLLHDVSHTAFSHLVDWVTGSMENEDFQDKRHKQFEKDPELSGILRSNGLEAERVFDLKNFHLLDSERPNLCAQGADIFRRSSETVYRLP